MFKKPSEGRSKQRPWRLRTRLAAGLGVLFVAIFALIAFSHFQYLNDRRDARLEDMQRVSETVAASLDGLTYDLESFSLSTAITLGDARVPIGDSVSEEARTSVNQYLQHLFESHGLLRGIFITDTNGRVVFDASGTSGMDLSHRSYITALQQGATEFWSEGFAGLETGRMLVAHSRAIVGPEGETTGFLVMALEASALASRLPAGLIDQGHISILDGDATTIVHVPEEDAVALGTSFSGWEEFENAQAGTRVVLKDTSLPFSPGDRYGSLVTMQNLGWVVAYSLPASEVEGPTTGLFLRDFLGLGAIVLAAFVAMWIFASRMVHPLTRLTEIAGAVSRGDDSVPPALASFGSAEVLMLSEAMADMRAAITEREDQLKAQNNVLNAIEHFGETLASELDLELSIQAIIDAGVELVDAEAVQLLYREHSGRQRVAIAGPRPTLALQEDHQLVRDVLAGKLVEVGELEPSESVQNAGTGLSARSVLGVPIYSRAGELEGAILLLRADANAFTSQHERLATGLVRWACIVLENARLYAESQELVSQLARSNAAKDEFLGIVSHELRTPITTIYGGTLLLRLRRESIPEQAFNDMIVSIAEEAERLHHLVEDLLAIARTELVSEKRPIDVSEILHTTVADFGSMHKRDVSLQMAPELGEALGDSTYFRQVVTNLLSNADKYTPLGLPIEISATWEAGEIVLRVRDNGDGIAEADLPRVFDSFFRAKGASEKAPGSGLGLTVCKRLIESLGGRIWAQNRPEGGLEVGFTLAAVEEGQPAVVGDGQNPVDVTVATDASPRSNGHAP